MDWVDAAALMASVLALALLGVWARRARREARRFELLDQLSRASEGLDLEATERAICRILSPRLADFCAIDVVSDGRPRRAAARAAGRAAVGRRLAACRPPVTAAMLAEGSRRTLEPRLFDRVAEGELRQLALEEGDREFLRSLGLRSAATLALRARGRMIGAVTLGNAWTRRRYRAGDAHFARVLAGRIALALDNAGLFSDLERAQSERAEIASTLEHALLPPPLPKIPGWLAAAMYRPAGDHNEVGGDFYDAFPIAGGWLLVLGDVTGHGAGAASVTAQARYTLRTAAWLSGDPLIALAALNRALLARGDSALCTVAAFALSSDPRQPVRLAVAGQVPPLLVDGERVTPLPETGPVLGAFPDAAWDLQSAALGAGQQIVAVTDGVTEATGRDGRFGEARLRAQLGGASHPSVAVGRLDAALRGFSEGPLDDDAAALAIAPAA